MNFIKILCETPLPHPCALKYKGIAFDGCHYYLTSPDSCEVIKYDPSLCITEIIKTLKPYTCICFDICKNCFWAAAAKFPGKLFKLDLCLQEIDCIRIQPSGDLSGAVVGISYECKRKGLLVCCTNCVLFLNTAAPREFEVLRKPCGVWNMGALSVAPSYLVLETQNGKQFVCVYDCTSTLISKYEIPYGYISEALLFSPCDVSCSAQHHFYLLATKGGCYPYLLEFALPCCEVEICHCNYTICRRCCEPCCPSPHPNPKDVCADLMESVALIETALSHILNAEGEKLQKVIATTDDVDKILAVNRSIQDTIITATHLEIILHNKLSVIRSCYEVCDSGESCNNCNVCDDCDVCETCDGDDKCNSCDRCDSCDKCDNCDKPDDCDSE